MIETVTLKQLTLAPDVKVLGCYLEHDEAEPTFFPVSVAGWGIEEVWREDGEQREQRPERVTLYVFHPDMIPGGDCGHAVAIDEAQAMSENILMRPHHASTEITGEQRDAMANMLRIGLKRQAA